MTVEKALEYVHQLDSQHGYVNTDKHEPWLKLLANEVERLRAEAEHRKHGFCISYGKGFTVYGTEEACKQTAEWYGELMEYRRKEAREEELKALRAENERLEAEVERLRGDEYQRSMETGE
jgi:uncharacterized small protein (DUF1192 family)